jgi:penicillin-binding protein 1A
MASEGYFASSEADIELLKERPIRLGRENARDSETAAYVVEEVRKQLEPKYGTELLMQGGLEITTTIDGQWQQAATDSVQIGLRGVERRRGFRPEAVRYYANPETDKDPSWQRFYEPGDTARGIILGWKNDVATVRMDRTQIEVPLAAFEWAGKQALESLARGAAPLFTVTETHPDGAPKTLMLDQMPEVQGALLAVESRTGEIRAMVGGYDFRRSQFNRATQAIRQVGSTMKPFVYGAALSEGYTPATVVDDTPIKYQLKPGARPSFNRRTGKNDNEYQPRNYERDFQGPVTFWEALSKSRNIPAVKTLEMAGISKAVQFATKCGIDERKIPPFPSLALGATDLTLKDMVRGYATIASGGYRSPVPFLVKKVVDRNGTVLEESRPASRGAEPDIDPVTNFQLIQMLQAVTSSGSAGGTSAKLGRAVAGKTGTTDEFTDAWFMGFSSRITCGVWVGLDAKMTIYPGANGARTALPIWQTFMMIALRAMPREDFSPPKGLEWLDIDIETGLRAGPGTSRMVPLAFRPGTGPNRETDPDILARIKQAKADARAKLLALEERPWGALGHTQDEPPIDPNDY